MPRFAIVACALLALVCDVAHAQLYSCVTPDGKRIYAHLLPPECAERRIEVMRSDGTPLPPIQPPLTPAERKKLEEQEKRRLDEEETKLAQKRSDRSLLETYASVEEIEAARQRILADYEANIDRAIKRREELKHERKKLDNEVEFYLKRELPEKLKRELAANNEMMKSQDKIVSEAKAEMARINKRFDAYANRFKELVDAGATPVRRLSQEKSAKR